MAAVATASVRCGTLGCRNRTRDLGTGLCHLHRGPRRAESGGLLPRLPASALRTPPAAGAVEVADLIDGLRDVITVPDEGPGPRRRMSLAEMIAEDRYAGACGPVSVAIHVAMMDRVLPGETSAIVRMDFDAGTHFANLIVARDGTRTVIDHTARQYGGDLDVPLIAELAEWEALIADRVAHRYGDTHRDTSIIS